MLVVIDDDPIVCETLSDVFDGTYAVKSFTSPKKALAVAEAEPYFPQVFIVDYRMPDMNGAEVARIIKNLNKNYQVILISGFTDFDDIQGLLKERQVDEFHRKPLDMETLKKSVEFRRKIFLKKSAL